VVTIKELAEKTGLTQQAIYKRLKSNGLDLKSLKDKATGHFTAEGLQAVAQLFELDITDTTTPHTEPQESAAPVENGVESEVEKLKKEVERLTTEVEKLNNLNSTMVEKVEALESERDYLRQTLQQAQTIQALTLAKLPALPAGNADRAGGLRGWWNRRKRQKGESENGNT